MTNIDWVTKRANCTLDDIFHHVIYGQIQNDVTIANALPRKKRDSSQYSIKYDKNPPSIRVCRQRFFQETGCALLVLDDQEKKIRIQPYKGNTFEIFSKWSDETANCDLYLKDHIHDATGAAPTKIEPWMISRKSLITLFFDD